MYHWSAVDTRAWVHAVIDPIKFLRYVLKNILKSLQKDEKYLFTIWRQQTAVQW